MHDALKGRTTRRTMIEDWMIDLLEDDRPAEALLHDEVTDGLHWMYRAALIRSN